MSDTEDRLPDVPAALVEFLQKKFRLAPPNVHDSLAQIQRAAGQQDVITVLVNLRDRKAEEQQSHTTR